MKLGPPKIIHRCRALKKNENMLYRIRPDQHVADYPQMFFLKLLGVMNPLEDMIKPTDLSRKKGTYKKIVL